MMMMTEENIYDDDDNVDDDDDDDDDDQHNVKHGPAGCLLPSSAFSCLAPPDSKSMATLYLQISYLQFRICIIFTLDFSNCSSLSIYTQGWISKWIFLPWLAWHKINAALYLRISNFQFHFGGNFISSFVFDNLTRVSITVQRS